METRILVVGGGIGGLALAALLKKQGVDHELWELSPQFRPAGAGIVMGVNAMGVLRGVGAADEVAERGRVLGTLAVERHDGKVLSTVDLKPLAGTLGTSVAIHRKALHEALARHVLPASIRLGLTVEKLTPAEGGVHVRDQHGGEHRFTLVVGADGLHSGVRKLVNPGAQTAYSGYTCWRVVTVDDDPHGDRNVEMWGPGRRVGIVGIGDGHVYAFFTLNAPRAQREEPAGAVTRLRERFSMFGGRVPALLARLQDADDAHVLHHDIDEIVVEKWTHGPITLLGDAAHGMTPNMGQGAGMALEDAWVLARMLKEHGITPAALSAYEAARRARVSWVQDTSRTLGRVAQWENGMARGVRDTLMSWVPASAGVDQLHRVFGPAVRAELGLG